MKFEEMKQKMSMLVDKAKDKKMQVGFGVATTLTAIAPAAFAAEGDVSGAFTSLTSADFMGVFNEIKGLIPIVLPAVIAFLAFRKGWSFIKSAVSGA